MFSICLLAQALLQAWFLVLLLPAPWWLGMVLSMTIVVHAGGMTWQLDSTDIYPHNACLMSDFAWVPCLTALVRKHWRFLPSHFKYLFRNRNSEAVTAWLSTNYSPLLLPLKAVGAVVDINLQSQQAKKGGRGFLRRQWKRTALGWHLPHTAPLIGQPAFQFWAHVCCSPEITQDVSSERVEMTALLGWCTAIRTTWKTGTGHLFCFQHDY